VSAALWRIWLREYGARGAITLAMSHGFTRKQILQVNREAREQERRAALKSVQS
jgi:hypothetical protein